jgi:hypothetical protein
MTPGAHISNSTSNLMGEEGSLILSTGFSSPSARRFADECCGAAAVRTGLVFFGRVGRVFGGLQL